MSQAKVDKYKKDKANRQKIMRREKRERMAWKVGGYAICLIAVFWIGYSAYSKYYTPPTKTYEVKTDAIDDYLDGLDETEAETTAEEDDTEASVEEADTEAAAEEADTDTEEGTETVSETSEETTDAASEASEEATDAASESSEEATDAGDESSEEMTETAE